MALNLLLPMGIYLVFRVGSGLQSDRVAFCIRGGVWICVNSQLGPGAVVCSRYLKKTSETTGRMALAGHFAMIPPLRTYFFDLSGIYRRC